MYDWICIDVNTVCLLFKVLDERTDEGHLKGLLSNVSFYMSTLWFACISLSVMAEGLLRDFSWCSQVQDNFSASSHCKCCSKDTNRKPVSPRSHAASVQNTCLHSSLDIAHQSRRLVLKSRGNCRVLFFLSDSSSHLGRAADVINKAWWLQVEWIKYIFSSSFFWRENGPSTFLVPTSHTHTHTLWRNPSTPPSPRLAVYYYWNLQNVWNIARWRHCSWADWIDQS